MNIKDFFESKTFKGTLVGLTVFVVLLWIFQLGVGIGYRKAYFSGRAGDNFRLIFGGRPQNHGVPPFRVFYPAAEQGVFSGYGTTGTIISINLPRFALETPENIERSVLIGEKTEIRKYRDNLRPEDLQLEDNVVIIGSPSQNGEIEARLIRYLPSEQFQK
ncbi:MAG TPA: hypothetical protein PKG74_02700 [Candidatus Colwellbacteria bacterium]|jgi:hypothetical protein|nr:hypothetical protein [Candidatus Colwellbacteria bacterium]